MVDKSKRPSLHRIEISERGRHFNACEDFTISWL